MSWTTLRVILQSVAYGAVVAAGHWRHGQELLASPGTSLTTRRQPVHQGAGAAQVAHLAIIVIGGTVVVIACLCSFLLARRPARRFIDEISTKTVPAAATGSARGYTLAAGGSTRGHSIRGYWNRAYEQDQPLVESSRCLRSHGGGGHRMMSDYELVHL